MIQSMTGFGSAERNGFRVDIRSLNHRYTEIYIKMPPFLIEHEMAVRNIIKDRFRRGRFDVNITLTEKQITTIKANIKIASELYKALVELKQAFPVEGTVDLRTMMMFKELILSEDVEYNTQDLLDAVNAAAASLYDMRVKEGEALREGMDIILRNLRHMHSQMGLNIQNLLPAHRDNLKRKITDLLSAMPVDEARLSQEIAFIAQKSDITEELARIMSHIDQFSFVLSGDQEAGRKLDFILQEILREANTIASKTDLIDIINISIDIKTEVEKLREQCQNIQ